MSRGLSKSKLMSFLQCPRKLWLEVHRPELAEVDPQTQAIFAIGHEVGEIARRLYDGGSGIMIEYETGMPAALARTTEALRQASTAPIFEATLERDGLLVRADVFLRDHTGPRIVEVKASTKLKPEYLDDCAIQSWVFEISPVQPRSISLAHVNNRFVYQGDGNYSGLLIENNITAEIHSRREQVPSILEQAKRVLEGGEPEETIGTRCWKPHDCPFQSHCWRKTDFPLRGLPAIGSKLDGLLAAGHYDVRHLPEALLKNDGQRRVWRAVQAGQSELLAGAAEVLSSLPYPRYYLDFETTGFAVPRWADTRAYQSIPFQWSLHIETRDGSLQHRECLDLTGEMPARSIAEALLQAAGDAGPVFMFTTFERTCIENLGNACPDLRPALMNLATRLVDLHPIVKTHYYHPSMHGSWSIKAILPTIAPEMDYSKLGDIQEGTAAQQAYIEAIASTTGAERREQIRKSLLEYCRHDTLAMIVVARYMESRQVRFT